MPVPPWTVWVVAGTVTAVVALVAGVRRGRATMPSDVEMAFQALPAVIPSAGILTRAEKPLAFMPPPAPLAADPVADELRAAYRRVGNPVLVLLAAVEDVHRPFQAWVVDRSRHGLRLAAEQPVAIGAVYNVRPVNAPPAAPWTALEVRHCAAQDNYWEVGGRFVAPPPMQVLVLYG